MIIIGDIHTKLSRYHNILCRNPKEDSIQIGDYGFKEEHDWHMSNIDIDKHKVLFGNHDYYPYIDMPHSLGNFKTIPEYNMMTIRGAKSTDKYLRVEGADWFSDEELSYGQSMEVVDVYENTKPFIVLSHDCPELLYNNVFGYDLSLEKNKSITSQLLQAIFEIHQPSLWIFGHHHRHIDVQIEGTRFICLPELSYMHI